MAKKFHKNRRIFVVLIVLMLLEKALLYLLIKVLRRDFIHLASPLSFMAMSCYLVRFRCLALKCHGGPLIG